ncbi:MAG: bifunctional diaminohydroxyphosphoribosylaminopyrimidine deaminase/5-amino-6-(5-phosphoribosylamino)uracil reductase RibD [Bacteroidales bacterium]|nr:bifunctional diaminohydroxyphosphoribosylaminopyrimidine deaminase/5-amino-6-(5-phosphoribosylamino)uracil reductase RibD [Bacteroidales bacterium]
MTSDELLMRRCFQQARMGQGHVSPNPMVGCVVVNPAGDIVSEGYHQYIGGYHAERNALTAHGNEGKDFTGCTLYVNLEPCSHYGKTPPCADLVVEKGIAKVFVSTLDPNPLVAGGGIRKLKKAGIEVVTGVLEEEGRYLNRRFFTFMEKHRPYVILKWAETTDGFMDIDRSTNPNGNYWITNNILKTLSHKWRTTEDAIMVGTNTVANDNPSLTARLWSGRNPLRITIDRTGRLPHSLHIFDGSTPTVVFTENSSLQNRENLTFVNVDFQNLLPSVLDYLYQNKIQSIIVEGGKQLINSFLQQNLWDEARVLVGNVKFGKGMTSPVIKAEPHSAEQYGDNIINYYHNPCSRTYTER